MEIIKTETFEFEEMEADHITPWHEGGKPIAGQPYTTPCWKTGTRASALPVVGFL